jgi:hypothetical protein
MRQAKTNNWQTNCHWQRIFIYVFDNRCLIIGNHPLNIKCLSIYDVNSYGNNLLIFRSHFIWQVFQKISFFPEWCPNVICQVWNNTDRNKVLRCETFKVTPLKYKSLKHTCVWASKTERYAKDIYEIYYEINWKLVFNAILAYWNEKRCNAFFNFGSVNFLN